MKWEYLVKDIGIMPADFSDTPDVQKQYQEMRFDHERRLNKLGLKGWELTHTMGRYFYFKRPIKEGLSDKGFDKKHSLDIHLMNL